MSIRTDIFNNHTTLFGILDEEGIPENNKRFLEVENRVSQLEDRTLQTQTQLVDLSTVVAKNRADFNSFELKTNNTLTSLEAGVLEAGGLAAAADIAAKRADENANAALTLTHQLEVRVVNLDSNVSGINTRIGILGLEVQNIDSTVKSQASQIQQNSNNIKSLQDQVALLGNPYVILQRRTNLYYREATINKSLFIDWDTPSREDTVVTANVGYWAMITSSSEGWTKRGLVTLIADWDTFRIVGTIAYPILQGVVRCQIISGGSTDSYLGTALVDK